MDQELIFSMDVVIIPLGPLGSNMYVVTSETGYLIVDPSVSPSEPALKTKLGDDFTKKIRGILLTHAHFDHSFYLDDWANVVSCPYFMSDDDKEILKTPNLNCSSDMFKPLSIKTETTDPGDSFTIDGLNISVIRTPGHTPGSVCFLFEEQKVMFTGDTLFAGSCGRSDLPRGNGKVLMDSLRKLKTLDDDIVIYPGHGYYSKIGMEKQFNPFL